MKLIAYTLAILSISFLAQAQGSGFVKVVSAVSTGSPSYVELGTIQLFAENGMQAGDASGFMSLVPKEYTYKIANKGATPPLLEGTIEIENDKTVALVFYTEAKRKKDGTIEHTLKVTPLTKETKEETTRLSLVSLSQSELLEVKVAGSFYQLPRQRAVEVPVKPNKTIAVKYREEDIGELETFEGFHVFGFFFDTDDGPAMNSIALEKIDFIPPKTSFDDEPKEQPEPAQPSPE